MNKNDSRISFMWEALKLAAKASVCGETPVGAVIVKDGKIIATGYNLRESKQDITLHAELIAIRKACSVLGSWRLDGCDIYVSLEPCIMCAGAIQQAKFRKLYFGPPQPKSGGVISKARILNLDMNHTVEYEGGILATESEELIKKFFTDMRCSDKATGMSKGERRKQKKSSLTE